MHVSVPQVVTYVLQRRVRLKLDSEDHFNVSETRPASAAHTICAVNSLVERHQLHAFIVTLSRKVMAGTTDK